MSNTELIAEVEDRMRRQEWLPAGLAIRMVAALRDAEAENARAERAITTLANIGSDLAGERDALQATLDAVKAYADERAWYGQRNRTVGSNRIASDLLGILASSPTAATTTDELADHTCMSCFKRPATAVDLDGDYICADCSMPPESGCVWDIEDEGLTWMPHDYDTVSGYCVNCNNPASPSTSEGTNQ